MWLGGGGVTAVDGDGRGGIICADDSGGVTGGGMMVLIVGDGDVGGISQVFL